MRSASWDLTTTARIRDAAVELFGREGFERTSVRLIAERAKVSPALVIHHFDSKEGLRAACDDFVVEEFLGHKNEAVEAGAATAMQEWLADIDRFRPLIDYLARMLMDDSTAGDHLFDALLAATTLMLDQQVAAGVVRESLDPPVTAAYVTVHGIVPLIMQRQLARALGDEQLSPELIRRSTLPILDLYTNGLYTDERLLEAAREALERTSGPSSDKGKNDPNQDPDPPR
jgi:TetR/AcrR family transcriptional regulator, regulator of cefoperazone and chloramphenicol sensitivity